MPPPVLEGGDKMKREYSYEEYMNTIKLLNRGLRITTVSRELGIPKSTLHYWRYGIYRPPSARWTPEPSKELAYVLGVLYGDGYIVREHGYHYDVELLVKDYGFAEVFSRNIAKVLNKRFRKPKRWGRSHNLWRVYYRSKAFYQWFREQNLNTLKQYIEYDRGAVKHFLRGLYDSEGYNYRCRKIFLYNNDLKLLNYIQQLLKKYFGIRAIGPYLVVKAGSIIIRRDGERIKANHNNYYIAISRKRDVQVFLSQVGFSIREKQLGLPRRRRQPKLHP